MKRTINNELVKSVIIDCRVIFLLFFMTFLKCECPIQCCPEEKAAQIETQVFTKSSLCIPYCSMIKPYLIFRGDRISLSSSNNGCKWLNKSLSCYVDSLISLGIEVNDTNLILLDTLRLNLGTKRSINIAINGLSSNAGMFLVKTLFLKCNGTMDTILVYDKESECNECNN